MKQHSIEASGFEVHGKKTRKEEFLEEINEKIPRVGMTEAISPYYPKIPKVLVVNVIG